MFVKTDIVGENDNEYKLIHGFLTIIVIIYFYLFIYLFLSNVLTAINLI